MTTFQSLLKSVNLKHLISTLHSAHLESPLPFYVLKIGTSTPAVPDYVSLSLTYSQYHAAERSQMKLWPNTTDLFPFGAPNIFTEFLKPVDLKSEVELF